MMQATQPNTYNISKTSNKNTTTPQGPLAAWIAKNQRPDAMIENIKRYNEIMANALAVKKL